MNKKAIEHPQEVIRMLFVALLLIFNIIIIYNFMSELEVHATYRINNLKYNAIAARIIYSSDCYAATDTYYMISGIARHQVHPGVVDLEKFNNADRLKSCIQNAEYEVSLKNLNTDIDLGSRKTNECNGWERTGNFLVLIKNQDKSEKGLMRIKICV